MSLVHVITINFCFFDMILFEDDTFLFSLVLAKHVYIAFLLRGTTRNFSGQGRFLGIRAL